MSVCHPARLARLAMFASVLWLTSPAPAHAQLGSLLSPGPLSRPHASLEGIANCQRCHEQGRKVTAARCLVCHKAVADRIARRAGVHRNVTDDCVACHAEHAGVDGQLRPFDQARFDHRAVAGFPLNDRHSTVAHQCAACHKTRSFLTLKPDCAACHRDVHKGRLGAACTSCHSARTAFKDLSGRFDHSHTRFQLAGAHQRAACGRCHVNGVFKGLKFAACADCHRDPHRGKFAPTCTTCHSTDTWRTGRVDHSRTAFPLSGRHAGVPCSSCHKQAASQAGGRARTCANCHRDVHDGQLGPTCQQCHNVEAARFAVRSYTHRNPPAGFFAGRHLRASCPACHTPRKRPATPMALRFNVDARCVACHQDVHRGSLGNRCIECHRP